MNRWRIIVPAVLVGVVLGAAVVFTEGRRPPSHAPVLATLPPSATTLPCTRPIAVATRPAAPVSYLDLVRSGNPLIAATQPLELPVDVEDAAHVVLHEPVNLDAAGHLWITSPAGPAAEQVLGGSLDPPQHVLRDRVLFAHWAADDSGAWSVSLVIAGGSTGAQLVQPSGRTSLPALAYRWDRAISWQNRIAVPADSGVAVVDPQHPNVLYHAMAGVPQLVSDTRGLLAWVPAGSANLGTGLPSIARFFDNAWTNLGPAGWLPRPLQLVPLLDGSVLEIASASADDDSVRLAVIPLETTSIDERHVASLVKQLGDADPTHRQSAFDELSRYGPGVLPRLEALADGEPPETRLRLRQLLRGRAAPALAGMELLENRLSVVGRSVDGSTMLFAPAGVRVPIADGTWDTVTPAWLCLRADGRLDRPLSANLVGDQNPAAATLSAYHDEWLITDAVGVRRWDGVRFVPLVSGNEQSFTRLVGIDRRGRWVFTTPDHPEAGTLLIDPTLADPTPRLPAWAMTIDHGSVGWDDHDWPTIKRGGAWALQADHWEPLADGDIMHEAPALADTPSPATSPTTGPLLVSADGTRYSGGNDAISVATPDGRTITWNLPTLAVGTSTTPVLLRTDDGRLFLFNQPGRCVCLQPTPGRPQPFTVAATFTHDLPNGDAQRIWLDRAGRIDIVYQHNRLVVLFPAGHIPEEIQNMMGG